MRYSDVPFTPTRKFIKCVVCGRQMEIASSDQRKAPLPAKRCSCGAIYCPHCFDQLPGIFGEELGPIFMLFTPLVAVAAYVYLKGPHPLGMVITLFTSLLGTVGLYLAVVAPLSRILKLAKQCQVCGGRTASDWSSIRILPEEEPEVQPAHQPPAQASEG